MGGFLGRLWRRGRGDAPFAGAAPGQPPSPRAPAPAPRAAPGQAEAGDPFAPFAQALGVEPPPAAPAEEPAPDPAEEALAARVLEHFQRNRPGPASAPSLSLRLLELVSSPRVEVGEMVRLISADGALAAGVLTVANSASYRAVQEIETVREAVVRLGIDEVGRVAGAISARSLFNPRAKAERAEHGPAFAAHFHRALTVATGAAALVLQGRRGRSDRAYLGGMLCDVGKPVALRSLAALQAAGEAPADPGLWARVLERVHLEVGGECHQEWNLPQYLTVIAVRHHDREIPAEAEFAELHAVRLCGALLDLRAPALAARAAAEIAQSAGALGLVPAGVRALDAELRAAAGRVAATFGL